MRFVWVGLSCDLTYSVWGLSVFFFIQGLGIDLALSWGDCTLLLPAGSCCLQVAW